MSGDGTKAYQMFLGVRRFHESISLLIASADSWLMSERDLKAVGSGVLHDMSKKPDYPKWWMPEGLDRWFWSPGGKHLCWLSVILCPRETQEGVPPFTEPLLSVGVIEMAKPVAAKPPKARWLANSVLWTKVQRDGTWHVENPTGKPGEHGQNQMAFMAVPLVDIESTDDLVETALQPLIDRLPARPSDRTADPDSA